MTAATPDPLDHPLYRIAHLHGDQWVTLRPSQQHSPRDHDADGSWSDAVAYECPDCEEVVIVAPPRTDA
jgi:hypothetical protein